MKRTLILLIAVVLLVCSLTACGTESNEPDESAANFSNFKVIEENDYLSYNLDTRVVYYMFSTSETLGYNGYGYTYFAPYISENGNFCKYINDEIVEITKTENTN